MRTLLTRDVARRHGAHLPHRPSSPRGRSTMNIAHRGASADLPENTLPAIERANELGADAIEIDVQRTSDGTLVVIHDATLSRTTDARRMFPARAPWRVGAFSHAELRQLDAGSWHGSGTTSAGVPTLHDVLATVRGRAALQIELKAPGLYPGVVDDLADAVSPWLDRPQPVGDHPALVVQSFDFAAMKALKTRLPDVTVGLLGAPPVRNLATLGTWAGQVNPPYRSISRDYVAAVQRHGMTCMVWTVDRRSAMRRAIRLGVDGVITNRPDVLADELSGPAVDTMQRGAVAAVG